MSRTPLQRLSRRFLLAALPAAVLAWRLRDVRAGDGASDEADAEPPPAPRRELATFALG